MNSDSSTGVRELVEDDAPPDGAKQQLPIIDLEIASKQHHDGVSDPVPNRPSNRLIYLDEDVMRSISSRLINDPNQFAKLSESSKNDNVKLEFVNDASTLDAAYFARRIWRAPANETLMDIPPLDSTTSPSELYPGAVIRARAFLRSREDLRPGRLTLTTLGNERLHVVMANRGVLSINKTYLHDHVLYVVGQLHRLRPLSITAAAVLLPPLPRRNR
jgi:hypothetical protein